MLGVGGLSFSRGMGVWMAMSGLTDKVESRYDSLNFPFILVALEKDDREIKIHQAKQLRRKTDTKIFPRLSHVR